MYYLKHSNLTVLGFLYHFITLYLKIIMIFGDNYRFFLMCVELYKYNYYHQYYQNEYNQNKTSY